MTGCGERGLPSASITHPDEIEAGIILSMDMRSARMLTLGCVSAGAET
jgi:hypothetical protein